MQVGRINLCTHKELENDEEVIESLDDFLDIDRPEFLEDQIVNTESEEREELGIFWGNEGEEVVNIEPAQSAEGVLHIHAVFDVENIEEMDNLLSDIIELLGELSIDRINADLVLEEDFADLDLPVSNIGEEVSGIKITEDNWEYIIQEAEEETTVFISILGSITLDESTNGSFLESKVESITDYVEGLK